MEVARLLWRDLLGPVMPKILGTIKIHWKIFAVKRKEQTGIDAMLQESL